MQASSVKKSLAVFFFVEKFYLEKMGATECLTGSTVNKKTKCASACGQLNIKEDETLFGGTCFSKQDLTCRMQQNLPSSGKFRLLCQLPGNRKYCLFATIRIFS